ncbi:HdeD family acid-resistance protein [Halothiobacillus sp.]|jgi:uncharacterized membrane protein HdeD (DUF308 family)|uniref:HdeD family acid-resistance protein n=1 Tax=Halothiobacillus sp. TaxID=1891311 RepID=UPI0019921130|nr:DUF308 domain-containing protein [Halothiobacillus sp.]MBD3813520.1 DUF308 domain-containing protein [Betaproteobacteria bacterium]MDD3576716.1 DUF308 domain-containing protein [Halothiobacillus sp.]MDD4965636.1 DUF308 domain-containing protein [Halothiobacillus sp.]MDY0146557.1 DUF308 domain-containing protein [Halothiobacillus sp.]
MSNIETQLLDAQVHGFGRFTLIIGLVLIVLGAVGVMAPVIFSFITATLFAWLLIVSGLVWAWHGYQHGRSLMDWLKAILLLTVGVLILFQPVIGIASIALLFSAYFLLDAFVSFFLSSKTAQMGIRIWMIFNGLIDIALAVVFLLNWPDAALWMVGLFVGISLIFDGWALTMIGWSIRRQSKLM